MESQLFHRHRYPYELLTDRQAENQDASVWEFKLERYAVWHYLQ